MLDPRTLRRGESDVWFSEDSSSDAFDEEGSIDSDSENEVDVGARGSSSNINPTGDPAIDLFRKIDRNSDGNVTLMEFIIALRNHPVVAKVSKLN